METIKECRYLILEGREELVRDIMSHVPRLPLLEVLIQNPSIHTRDLHGLIPLITNGSELDFIHKLAPTIARMPSNHVRRRDEQSHELPPGVEILAQLIPFFRSEDPVFQELDLSQTFTILWDSYFTPQTQRKYATTLIHYLDRGAFDKLSGMEYARWFLSDQVPYISTRDLWEDEENGWKSTLERAKYYVTKIDALKAGM